MLDTKEFKIKVNGHDILRAFKRHFDLNDSYVLPIKVTIVVLALIILTGYFVLISI